MEGPSLAGAYRFEVRPGARTVIEIGGQRREVFFRSSVGPICTDVAPFVIAALLPAMKEGAPLRVERHDRHDGQRRVRRRRNSADRSSLIVTTRRRPEALRTVVERCLRRQRRQFAGPRVNTRQENTPTRTGRRVQR